MGIKKKPVKKLFLDYGTYKEESPFSEQQTEQINKTLAMGRDLVKSAKELKKTTKENIVEYMQRVQP